MAALGGGASFQLTQLPHRRQLVISTLQIAFTGATRSACFYCRLLVLLPSRDTEQALSDSWPPPRALSGVRGWRDSSGGALASLHVVSFHRRRNSRVCFCRQNFYLFILAVSGEER